MTEFESGHKPDLISDEQKGYRLICECGFKGRWVPTGEPADFLSETMQRRYLMHLMKALPEKYGISF